MWIVDDDTMADILGGEFTQVVVAKKIYPNISLNKLYKLQFDYFSYQGFNKFFRTKLGRFINGITYVDEDSFCNKVLKFISRKYNYGKKK